jgi:uncharacterized protein YqhQ
MEPAGLLAADALRSLPRLGGIARPDGVVILSEHYWALARRDGTLVEGTTRQVTSVLRHVPVLRGLVRLGVALAPLGAVGVSSRRDRLVLGLAIALSVALAFVPGSAQLVAGLVLTGALLAWVFRGRTLPLHGAEHRAIAAAESRQLASTWLGTTRPSRFSPRCGTNFGVLVLALVAVLYLVAPASREAATAIPLQLGALGVTMEVWLAVQRSRRLWARALLLPGLLLQRLTTREPALEETRVALRAVASVLQRELASPG